ncbi:MAG: hypothetical protein DMG83_10025 [Acidobacteria bacterium]|nr:MAG: hypothetical protein DMG83_10025 [Acidobacteriota bacterium]
MNYLRLAIAILLAAFAQCTYANSIPTFHVTEATMLMFPNDGSGDNVVFTFTGPGVSIAGDGGMACSDWCSSPISPDLAGTPSQIFISGLGLVILGGVTYDAGSLVLTGPSTFFDEVGGLNPSTSGIVGSSNGALQFNLTLPTNGSWQLNFVPTTDQFGNPAILFTNGTFFASAPLPTPEPSTIGLMLTGLAGMAGIIKRKGKFRR